MKVNFTETVLRDANQSLIATRMPFADFEPVLKARNIFDKIRGKEVEEEIVSTKSRDTLNSLKEEFKVMKAQQKLDKKAAKAALKAEKKAAKTSKGA